MEEKQNQEIRKINPPYISPTPGEFPIIAGGCFPNSRNDINENVISILKECGFNAGMFLSDLGAMVKALKMVTETTGFRFIPVPHIFKDKGDLFTQWENYLNYSYENDNFHSSQLLGSSETTVWEFLDEPYFNQLDSLGKALDNAYQKYPKKMFMVNLVGWTGDENFVGLLS